MKAEPALREAVLAAAAKEFAALGYEAASLNRILERAGLSKGAFYYYFDDKADLAVAVLNAVTDEFLKTMGNFVLPGTVADFWAEAEKIQRRALDSLARFPEQTELIAKLGMALLRDSELMARVMPAMADKRQAVAALWEKGRALGAVRTDIPLELLLSVLQGIKESLARALLPRDAVPSAADLERMARIQWDLFRRVAEVAPPRGGKRTRKKK